MRKQKKQRKSEQNSRDKNYAYSCQRERGNEKGKEKVREEKRERVVNLESRPLVATLGACQLGHWPENS